MRVLVAIALVAFALHSSAVATTIVSPSAFASIEGPGANGAPFDVAHGGTTSHRYQQVYSASEFSGVSGPVFITQLAFRPDHSAHPFDGTIASIQLNLSTVSSDPDELSLEFGDNIGADEAVAFSGSLHLSSAIAGPDNGPKDFDVVVDLETPFLYDPAHGNLLLEVLNFEAAATGPLDFVNTADGISRVFTLMGGAVTDPTGVADSGGLVTRFTITSVPEPSSIAIAAVALVGLIALGRRMRARASSIRVTGWPVS